MARCTGCLRTHLLAWICVLILTHIAAAQSPDDGALAGRLLTSGGAPAAFTHVLAIDDDSGVGTQFEVADINGDGLLDVIIANKRGVFVFEQVRNK